MHETETLSSIINPHCILIFWQFKFYYIAKYYIIYPIPIWYYDSFLYSEAECQLFFYHDDPFEVVVNTRPLSSTSFPFPPFWQIFTLLIRFCVVLLQRRVNTCTHQTNIMKNETILDGKYCVVYFASVIRTRGKINLHSCQKYVFNAFLKIIEIFHWIPR